MTDTLQIGDVTFSNEEVIRGIRAHVAGTLYDLELIDLFNWLIVYNFVWRMGGTWPREARMLIENGYCVFPCAGIC